MNTKLSISKIKNFYYNDKLTLRKIAKLFKVTHVTILKFMRENNLDRRSRSESQKGRKISKKQIQILRLSRLGKGTWNKGLKMPKETCKKMSLSAIERFKNPKNHPMLGRKHSDETKLKQSKVKIGIKQSKETREKHRKSMIGNKHAFVHGQCSSPYSSKFTNELKQKIRCRDGHKCQICNKTEAQELKEINRVLCVHHIDYNKQNCDETNLISLCLKCHLKSNYNRKKWIKYFKISKGE